VLEISQEELKKERYEANLKKLASAFLSIALDLIEEEKQENLKNQESEHLTTPLTISGKSSK